MRLTYEQMKELEQQSGKRVTDLIALAAQNDPFYVGRPADLALAEWLAHVWQRFGYTGQVHIRRVHYQLVSQDPPIQLPNGMPYTNTEACWNRVLQASKHARYLELVDPAVFVDRKHPETMLYSDEEWKAAVAAIEVVVPEVEGALPDFPDPPQYGPVKLARAQRYHLEVVCEKSTMNNVLIPLCERYGMNLQTGAGELSITAALNMVRRIEQVGKPAGSSLSLTSIRRGNRCRLRWRASWNILCVCARWSKISGFSRSCLPPGRCRSTGCCAHLSRRASVGGVSLSTGMERGPQNLMRWRRLLQARSRALRRS
ncbi:hypothetical protein [Ktedonobacter sp. SOSP1-52]|uniref:hypothetical protein n=1 Tax=Ktedonobacter sp. SOSP1-52 TaxID=2778366 RepID=UPI001F41A39C|nr:hypothetical protein [Ktedonobacter sp. SOSP1-52]